MQASITMINLTATIANIRGSARAMQPTINGMTKDLMNAHHALYVVNLSGTKPSTASSPLPVGVVTNDLRSKAEKRQINQYSYEIKNDSDHAEHIEFGTQKMVARRPLQNASEQIEKQVPGEMGKVMRKVWA